jgi:uncharacterized membrane protein YphA (DoxX/SURF4 family)
MDRRRVAGRTAGVLLGAVLLVAAYAKLLDPMAFAEQIELEGLARVASAHALALGAIGLEVGLGLALVLGLRRWWVLLPMAALVAVFLFLTGRAYWLHLRGVSPPVASCGCFGNLLERSPAAAFWQDLGLLAPLLGLAFLGRPGGRPRPAPLLVAALGAVGAVAFAQQAPALPLDDLATRLRPGAELAALCAGAGRERVCLEALVPELAAGRHLVVLADLEDEAFGEQVAALNDYAAQGGGPTLWVLTSSPPEAHRAFFWRFGPAFEVREAPRAVLRSLYRRLPRSCLVAEGVVAETFSGLPPLARFTGDAAASPRT